MRILRRAKEVHDVVVPQPRAALDDLQVVDEPVEVSEESSEERTGEDHA